MIPKSPTLRGILSAILAMTLFSVMDVIIKSLRDDYGTVQIFFFRSAVALLPIWAMVQWSGGVAALRTRRLGGHIARSLLTIAFLLCFFYGLSQLPLTDAYAISFAAPLFITAMSVPLLGEHVGPRRWLAVAVGFVGVLIILRPGSGTLSAAGLIVLAGALLYSLAMIYIRQLSRTETQAAIVFYLSLTSTVLAGAALPFVWVWPSGTDWLALIAIGLIGGVGQILITKAYSLADAAIVSPFQYIQILWGLVFGFAFFGDLPDAMVLLGAAIVIASGLYILHRETRRRPAVAAGDPVAVMPGKRE